MDPPGVSRKLAGDIAADHRGALGVSLLYDPQARTIVRYGIRDEAYRGQKEFGIPHPALFVLDQQGRVRWEKVETDYTERPANEDVAAALDAID